MTQNLTEKRPPGRPKENIVSLDRFAQTFKVKLKDGDTILVPVDELASNSRRKLLVAKAYDLLEHHIEKLRDKSLTPTEIKDMIAAVEKLDGLQREQYVTSLAGPGSDGGPSGTRVGRSLEGIIRGAAKGAAEGSASAFVEKLKQMEQAGKQAQQVIETKATEVP